MDFGLSEEQELLQSTVHQYLENECPVMRVREIFEGETGSAPDLWKGLVELGVAGLTISEEHGGAGLELLDLALVSEVMGRHAAPLPFLGHALASLAIALGGSEAQQRKYLPQLASGGALGTVALAEEGGAWQPEEWTLPAGDTLSGAKRYVAHAAEADLIVVGTAGGGLAVVERNAPGVELEGLDGADRTRRVFGLSLAGTPCDPLAQGEAAAPRVRDAALTLLAADAFGGASRCVEMAVEYAKTREQFGVTIGHFQALKHQLADMALATEPARGLYWYAAHAFDHLVEESARIAAIAKAHVTDNFMQVARDTVEAHGGIGYT